MPKCTVITEILFEQVMHCDPSLKLYHFSKRFLLLLKF